MPFERPGPVVRGLFVKLLHLWAKSYGGKNVFSVSDTSGLEEKSEFSQSGVKPMAFQLLVQLGWITLSSGKISIQRIVQSVFLILIHWIVTYPMGSVIQPGAPNEDIVQNHLT